MYLGNSRLLLGKNTNQKMIGEWLAIAPSTASSGSYGINGNGGGFCSEVFDGHLYVGGEFTNLINGTTTSSAYNLIRYDLQDNSATWESCVANSDIGKVYGLRNINIGDHILIAGENGLYYQINTTTTNKILVDNSNPYSSISNTFDVFTTGTPGDSVLELCAVGRVFGDELVIYDGSNHTVTGITGTGELGSIGDDNTYSPYYSNQTGKIIYITQGQGDYVNGRLITRSNTIAGATVEDLGNILGGQNYPDTIADGEYNNKITIVPGNNNKLYLVINALNDFHEYDENSESFTTIDINSSIGNTKTIGTVVYNDISFLIIGGEKGIYLVDPSNTAVTKDLGMPASDPLINSITVDSDSTIYVTGNFSFTDKNGVTAKNVAKFVPDASKLP